VTVKKFLQGILPVDEPNGQDSHPYRGSWKNRRRIIFCALRSCVGALWFQLTTAVALAYGGMFNAWVASFYMVSFPATLAFAAMIVGSYVFGAAWDDKNFMNMLGRLHGTGGGMGGMDYGMGGFGYSDPTSIETTPPEGGNEANWRL